MNQRCALSHFNEMKESDGEIKTSGENEGLGCEDQGTDVQ